MSECNWLEIKQKTIEKSKEIRIDKIGFTDAAPFLDAKNIFLSYQKNGFSSGFEEQDLEKRIYPELSLPGVKSILAIALAYPSQEPVFSKDDNIRGRFSRASWGLDYHFVLRKKLGLLDQFLKQLVPGCSNLIMVDTGALSDRAVASRAGLGWIGKNGNLITPEFGSFVFLGELLTTLPLPADRPLEFDCGQCQLCQNACPLGAIIPEGRLIDARKCLAFQTLNKAPLTEEVKEKIGSNGYLYGCDLCQLVCPHNKKIDQSRHFEFAGQAELIKPILKDFLQISKREFKEQYGQSSGSWRGKKVLDRNAILILAQINNQESENILKQTLLNDPREDIRELAAWALKKQIE